MKIFKINEKLLSGEYIANSYNIQDNENTEIKVLGVNKNNIGWTEIVSKPNMNLIYKYYKSHIDMFTKFDELFVIEEKKIYKERLDLKQELDAYLASDNYNI